MTVRRERERERERLTDRETDGGREKQIERDIYINHLSLLRTLHYFEVYRRQHSVSYIPFILAKDIIYL